MKKPKPDKFKWSTPELQICNPPEDLTVSEWSEKYRVLTEPTEEKGPLRMIRTPYLGPIIDAFLDTDTEIVVFCKSAQIAGTEGMISIIGYYAHQEPCSIMLVLADKETALYMAEKRIKPMFTSPKLTGLIDRATKNGISFLNQAYLVMGWASSVARLASRPIKIMLFDEVDKPGYYVTTREANPISLGVERTETFFNRKIGILSTPSMEDGNIWRHLNSCDVIYDWHVPCLHCGQYQPLRWSPDYAPEFKEGMYRAEDGSRHRVGGVVWDGGGSANPDQVEQAGYACGECGGIWSTVEKNNAVEQGKMVARKEPKYKPKKVGFHVNRLYSLLGKSGDLPKLVGDWLNAQKDLEELQGFINSTLAEPWRQKAVDLEESTILARKCDVPAVTVPDRDIIALTAGIDVQKHGFYYTVWAWTHDLESWMIDYGFLPTWEDVRVLVFENRYQVQQQNREMGIWRAGIDTGGGQYEEEWSQTEEIYTWLRSNGRGVVWGIKGLSKPSQAKIKHSVIDRMPGKGGQGQMIPGGLVIFLLDTAKLKEDFFWRLSNSDTDPQPMHLHADTGEDFAKHILAEEKRRKKDGSWEWVQVSKDNHWLDCSIYAHAVADPQWHGGIRVLKPKPKHPGVVGGAQHQPKPNKQEDDSWIPQPTKWM